MKKNAIALTLAAFLLLPCVRTAAQESSGATGQESTGFMLVPAGDSVVLMGMVPPPSPSVKGFRIYRKKEGEDFKQIVEMPLWVRTPDVLVQELGEKDFADMAKRFQSATPAELMHKAGTNPAINLTIVAMLPRYPKLLELFENSYIYWDKTIEPGAKYEYVVKSFDAGGNELEVPSGAPLRATGGEKESPSQPIDPRIESGDKEAKLYWKKGLGETVGTLDGGYMVYRKEKDIDFRLVGYVIPLKGEEQAFFNTELENGVEYTYYVKTLNPAGIASEKTPEMKAKPHDLVPPQPPKNLKADFKDKKVTLTWDASKEEDFAYYNMYRTDDPNKGDFEKANNTQIMKPEFVDESVKFDGKTHFYSVTAVDSFENESAKIAPQYVTVPDYTPPEPPRGIQVNFDKKTKTATLTWEPSPTMDDVAIYVLFKGGAKDSLQQISTIDNLKNEITDPYVSEGQTYYYTIKAQDSATNFSEVKQVVELKVPDMTPPPTPYNLEVSFKIGDPGITLKWNDEKAPDSKEYQVFRSTEEMGTYEKIGAAQQAECVDATAKKGVLYWYSVKQLDVSDNESNLSRAFSGKVIDADPPAVPKELKAEFKKDGVNLKWAANAEDDLAGYNVYLVDLFRFEESPVNKEPVNETAFVIKYTEVGAEGNVGVKLKAVDTSGNESKPTALLKPE